METDNHRLNDHLNLTLETMEKEKSAINEQFQTTVARMNGDIHDLQKRIDECDAKINEGKLKEGDLERKWYDEKDQVKQRDNRID